MKLLFDQNISFRIVKKIAAEFLDSKQVRELGLENSSDIALWQYAKQYNFSIVTFDSDFFDIANLYGHPPKIIWLRMDNTSTNGLSEILIEHTKTICDFISSENQNAIACLEIY